ncbi:MAG: LacI family DNA-binding transcriptional regulator [Acetivibrionales bacterium]
MESIEKKLQEKKKLNINDIAKAAGVSISTVSRVINNSGLVNKNTRKKVQRIIDELNFTPNAIARSLVKKTSKTIGLMIPDITNSYFIEFIKSVEDVMSKHKYFMLLCNTNQESKKEEYYINEMLERRTDGLMIISTSITNKELLDKAKKSMHIVSIQADIDGVDRIDTTDEQGTSSVIEHLIELGHRKIAFIGLKYDISVLRNRFLGYKRTLEKHGIPIRDDYIIKTESFVNPGYSATLKLLGLEDRPTAIHCLNDSVAIGAYTALTENNIRVPEDISISGFDNTITSKLITPRLTTVAQPITTMGEIAAKLLIQNITEGSHPVKQSILLPTKLIIRDSTAAPKM